MTFDSPAIQKALDVVEQLSAKEQAVVLEVLYHRLLDQQHNDLLHEVREARAAYQAGDFRRGTVEDLLAEIDV